MGDGQDEPMALTLVLQSKRADPTHTHEVRLGLLKHCSKLPVGLPVAYRVEKCGQSLIRTLPGVVSHGRVSAWY